MGPVFINHHVLSLISDCVLYSHFSIELFNKVVVRYKYTSTMFVGVIRAFHQELNAYVSAAGETSDPFLVVLGVKQGCALAPVLFNLFVSAVLHVFHHSPGGGNGIPVRYRYDGGGLFNLARLKARTKCNLVVVNELQYADDAAFVCHTA